MIPSLHGILRGDVSKPVVLFLHGYLGAHDEWDEIMEQMLPQFRCVAVDLPGHGLTPSADDPVFYSFPGAAEALIQFMQTHDIPRAHVVGYSMGGRLALYLAVHHPEMCDRVVVESASPGLLEPDLAATRRAQDAKWAARFESESLPTVLSDWYRQPIFASLHTHPDVMAVMMERRLRNRPDEIARAMRGFSVGAQTPLWDALPGLERDVLVLAGEADRKYRQLSDRMAASSPRIRTAVVADAGHNVHCEQPERFAALCTEWFLNKETER